MRRLICSEFVTLDGVMQAPGHDDHPDGKNAWALAYAGEDQERFKVDEVFEADAFLLGRVTYEIWAAFWPTAPKDEGFADRMNAMTKYVVSTRLREPTWGPATIISEDVVERLRQLKQGDGGDILLNGSADLSNSLIPHGVIDEFRLMVFPVLLGSGKRLFAEATDVSHLELTETRTFESGVTVLTYHPADRSPTSKYVKDFAWTGEQQRSWEAVRDVDRVLATVLFTDIVGSTQKAAELGDQAWRRLIDQHDKASRAEVERYKGRYVKSTGDGMLATFDAPTRALRCAFGLNDALSASGLEIRVGDPHRRDRGARRRRRRDRGAHRVARARRGRRRRHHRHPDRPRPLHGDRPLVRLIGLRRAPRRTRRVGAFRRVRRRNRLS